MHLRKFTIDSPLLPYVRSLWAFTSPSGLPPSATSVVTPTGNAKLILACENPIIALAAGQKRENPDRSLYLLGVRDVPVTLSTRNAQTTFIGVDFHPQGAFALFGLPMFELTNRVIPVTELFPKWHEEVAEIVPDLSSVSAKVERLQNLLHRSLNAAAKTNPVVDFCVASIEESLGTVPITLLVERSGYSRRYIEMLFRTYVGISPKSLASIVRFQSVYRRWAAQDSYAVLLGDAYRSYYDQAHFAKEFKKMTGFPPRHFARNVPNEFGRRLTLNLASS